MTEVVRLTLVPAVMAIVGPNFWYHPQWFSKYVPDPDIEGEKLEQRLAAARFQPNNQNDVAVTSD